MHSLSIVIVDYMFLFNLFSSVKSKWYWHYGKYYFSISSTFDNHKQTKKDYVNDPLKSTYRGLDTVILEEIKYPSGHRTTKSFFFVRTTKDIYMAIFLIRGYLHCILCFTKKLSYFHDDHY